MPEETNDGFERAASGRPLAREGFASLDDKDGWAERATAQARAWERQQAVAATDEAESSRGNGATDGSGTTDSVPMKGAPGVRESGEPVPYAEAAGQKRPHQGQPTDPTAVSSHPGQAQPGAATVPAQSEQPEWPEQPANPATEQPQEERPATMAPWKARYGRNVPIVEPRRDATGRILTDQASTWGYGPNAPRIETPTTAVGAVEQPANTASYAVYAGGVERPDAEFGAAPREYVGAPSGSFAEAAGPAGVGAAGSTVVAGAGRAAAGPAAAGEPYAANIAYAYATADEGFAPTGVEGVPGSQYDASASQAGVPTNQADVSAVREGVAAGTEDVPVGHACSKPAGSSFSRGDWKRPSSKHNHGGRGERIDTDESSVPVPKPSSVPGGDFPEYQEPVPGSRKDRAQKSLDRTREKFGEKKKSAKSFLTRKTPSRLKNPTELQVRLRTGVVYVGLSIILALISDASLVLLLCILAGICAGEFFYILRSDDKLPNEFLGTVASVAYPICYWLWGMEGVIADTGIFLIALLVWYVFWQRARIVDVAVSFFGALYTGFLLSSLIIVRQGIGGLWGGMLVVGVFASVWINDGFAYLFGSRFGKHKMAPRISPKKSWEGFAAGLVGSVLTWCLMTLIPGLNMPLWMAVLFGLVCGLAGVLGDLAESRIKRNSGVKDSGTIMPGHGGLLDRSDSMFLASAAACVLLIMGGCIVYV